MRTVGSRQQKMIKMYPSQFLACRESPPSRLSGGRYHSFSMKDANGETIECSSISPYEQSISTPVVVPGMSGVTSIHTTICDQSFFVKAQ